MHQFLKINPSFPLPPPSPTLSISSVSPKVLFLWRTLTDSVLLQVELLGRQGMSSCLAVAQGSILSSRASLCDETPKSGWPSVSTAARTSNPAHRVSPSCTRAGLLPSQSLLASIKLTPSLCDLIQSLHVSSSPLLHQYRTFPKNTVMMHLKKVNYIVQNTFRFRFLVCFDLECTVN